MKRYVKAATHDSDYHESHFLDPLYNEFHDAGYDVKLGDNLSLIVTPIPGKEYVPDLKIATFENDGVYTFGCKLSFPDVSVGMGDDTVYYDDAEYAVKQFELAARLVTKIVSMEYDPNAFED